MERGAAQRKNGSAGHSGELATENPVVCHDCPGCHVDDVDAGRIRVVGNRGVRRVSFPPIVLHYPRGGHRDQQEPDDDRGDQLSSIRAKSANRKQAEDQENYEKQEQELRNVVPKWQKREKKEDNRQKKFVGNLLRASPCGRHESYHGKGN